MVASAIKILLFQRSRISPYIFNEEIFSKGVGIVVMLFINGFLIEKEPKTVV